MTIRLSSGLRDAVISNFGLGYSMQSGHIRFFTGTQPASADDAETGTPVGVITEGGIPVSYGETSLSGLRFALGRKAGTLTSFGGWSARVSSNNLPGWWRFVASTPDDGTDSLTLARIDGSIAGDGLLIDLGGWVDGALIPISDFSMALPAQ